jgi:hypothetical protein
MKTVSRKRREVDAKTLAFLRGIIDTQYFLPFNKSIPPFSNLFFFILNFKLQLWVKQNQQR